MALLLSEKDLKPLFRAPSAMDDLIRLMEAALKAHGRGEVAGHGIVDAGVFAPARKYRVMAAAVPGDGYGLRVSALFPGATDAYFHLLFDDASGALLALIAGRALNGWRTGAVAGVAVPHLAPAGAGTLGILGSGPQARGQLTAIRRAWPALERARVYSPREAQRAAFAGEMSAWLGIPVDAVGSAREALRDAGIVSLATSSAVPALDPGWIAPGALVISLSNGQLPPELVANSRVIVSWKEEIVTRERPRRPYAAMIAAGAWSGDRIAAELGEVILGKVAGRRNSGETVLFDLVGMPLWDTTAAAWAYRWAKEHRAGSAFSLD